MILLLMVGVCRLKMLLLLLLLSTIVLQLMIDHSWWLLVDLGIVLWLCIHLWPMRFVVHGMMHGYGVQSYCRHYHAAPQL